MVSKTYVCCGPWLDQFCYAFCLCFLFSQFTEVASSETGRSHLPGNLLCIFLLSFHELLILYLCPHLVMLFFSLVSPLDSSTQVTGFSKADFPGFFNPYLIWVVSVLKNYGLRTLRRLGYEIRVRSLPRLSIHGEDKGRIMWVHGSYFICSFFPQALLFLVPCISFSAMLSPSF